MKDSLGGTAQLVSKQIYAVSYSLTHRSHSLFDGLSLQKMWCGGHHESASHHRWALGQYVMMWGRRDEQLGQLAFLSVPLLFPAERDWRDVSPKVAHHPPTSTVGRTPRVDRFKSCSSCVSSSSYLATRSPGHWCSPDIDVQSRTWLMTRAVS